MKRKSLIFFLFYFIFAIVFTLYNLYAHFTNPITVSEASKMTFPFKVYVVIFLGFLLFLLSIISVIIIYREKFPKFMLSYPFFNILYFAVWLNVIPLAILDHYGADAGVIILDKILKFDYLSYFVVIILSLYSLYRLVKIK